jgi:phage baseplate assembly protein W
MATTFHDAEDTNLSRNATKIWKDLNITFSKHPVTDDVTRVFDVTAIKRSVMMLIQTNYGERPFQPWLGSNIRRLLFENMDFIQLSVLRTEIEQLIGNFEPRVVLTDLDIVPDDANALMVTIHFTLINAPDEQHTIETILERIK